MASRPKADRVRMTVRSIEGAHVDIEPPSAVTNVRFLIEPEKPGVVAHIDWEGGTILVHVPSPVFLKALRDSINLSLKLDHGVPSTYAQEQLLALVADILRRRTKLGDGEDKSP